MFADYADFEIDIQPRSGAVYPFTVHAPGGDARGAFAPPTDDPAYRALAARLAALDTDEDLLTRIGQFLFGALFHGQVKEVYARSQGMLRPGQGLRIRLSIDPRQAEVAGLPWELLNDPDQGPLALLDAPVVRYIPQPLATPTLKASLPLKVLLSGAGAERELQEVQAALAQLGEHVQVTLEPRISAATLQQRLREGFDIWHFVGRGGFGDDGATGRLYLEGPDGPKPLGAPELGIMLNRSRVRLVVLDTSDSARLATDPFRSLAPALVRAQVPAVVAMQSTIAGDAARAFARNFYQALAEGFPLDTCMTEGRKAVMSAAGLGRADWGIPVVYTRAPDGVLFDLPAPLTPTLPGTIVARPSNGGAAAAVGIHAQAGALLSAPPPAVVQLGAAPSPPRRRRDFRDREGEQRDLLAELRPGGGAWLYGPPGCGLSTLLTQIAANTPPGALPSGVVCVDGADEPPHLDDVLQRLFARFYTSSTTMRVDPGAAQTYLGQLQALVVLDRLPLGYDELTRLVETTLPNSAALVAADGEGPATLLDLSLGSLPRADAAALCATIAQIDGAQPQVAAALDRICAALGDLPLPLLLVARLLRQQVAPIGQLAAVLEEHARANNHSALALAAGLLIEGLSEQERAVLAAVVVGKPHAHIETLAGSTGLGAPALRAMLQRLIGLGLVLGNEDRYEVATHSLRRVLEELLPTERERSRAAAFLAGAAGARAGDLAWIERERGNLMQAIQTLLSEGQAAQAGALAKSVQPAMVLRGLWGSWGDVINWAETAANQSGDGALRAWALHERGTRAGLLGDRATAADALGQALELRRRMGDRAGAAATRRNMAYLELFPPLPPATSGGSPLRRPFTLAAGTALTALLVAILWIAGSFFLGAQAPVAAAEARPNSGKAPLTVTFDAGGSTPADGAGLVFIWDFGDGTRAETDSPITTHTYEQADIYQATLHVRDGDGRISVEPALLRIDVDNIATAPTDTPTSTPTSLPPTLTPEPARPTDTPTSTPTDTPTPTPTDTPTPTPTPTDTPTPSPPDLVVISLVDIGPATRRGRAFVEVPIRVVIGNQGGTPAEPFKVSVRYTDVAGASFTVAFTVEGQDDLWYPYTTQPLAGAETTEFEGVLTFPFTGQNTQVEVIALADSCDGEELTPVGCRVAESDEQNNESKPLPVNLRPGID